MKRAIFPHRLVLIGLMLCGSVGAALPAQELAPMSRPEAFARAAALSALGQKLFFDPSLSASGRMSCATCHDPAFRFGPSNRLAVQLGGADLRTPGLRAVPSLTYIQAVPQFSEHYYDSDEEGDASIDNGPTGGFTWDGRVDRRREQAKAPLLSPFEMANADAAALARRVRAGASSAEMLRLFGADLFGDADRVLAAVGEALEAYQQDAATFYPYSSKYDAYLDGRARLSEQEMRGLKLFDDRDKGNCASCHISRRGNDGTAPQFTDFGLVALGVPRNAALPANADATFYDLGACGPLRTDLAGRDDMCGRFRTPSLRNVALRQVFFHNGLTHDLRKAVAFYVERDTKPDRWYPRNAQGQTIIYNDLPVRYFGNVNQEPPFGGMPGDKPALTDDEIDDIVAFLQTLTDGYRAAPAAMTGK